MSKGNMLLGHARGKVGSLVFARANGQQITRARAEVVKNPQTEKQMIQRIIMATVAQAYSRFQPICDHSFEGVAAGQESMSYFTSKNLKNLRDYIAAQVEDGMSFDDIVAFVPVGSNEYAPNEYIISKGSLPAITPTFTGSTMAKIEGIAGNTYQDVLDAFGLQRGDQLTLITTQGSNGQNTIFHYARVILDPTNGDGTQASLGSAFIVDGAINLPSPRNEGDFANLTFADGAVSYNFSAQSVSGAAVIVSRQKADGSWSRSTSKMVLNPSGVVYQKSLQECLDLIASGSISTLSAKYLNNAGKGRIPSQTSPSIIQAANYNGTDITRGANVRTDLPPGSDHPLSATTNAPDGAKIGVYDAQGAVVDNKEWTVSNGAVTVADAGIGFAGKLQLKVNGIIVDTYCTFVNS